MTEQNPFLNLSPEQLVAGDDVVELAGLSDEEADTIISINGATASIRQGLGWCADRLDDRTPDEIADMARAMIKVQAEQGAVPMSLFMPPGPA